ncbi:non-specific lipid transfer protein-like 1 [Chenopodium quinoa]|uniref:non-specific lipid transfer protein-like 1 n=1 Tax=Chenopodium quinoa TaxID=63459 RepID=UPI000B793E02|nr:non-specific lipid transfer protein-like 1 [Chenopodium quinoa]
MDRLNFTSSKAALSILTYILVVSSVNGQVTTPCTASMIATFTPCMNYLTSSTANGSSPSSNCCGALRSVMSSSVDCACLMVTASIPLPQLVNRTLALGLPRVCNSGGVPIKCEASGSPLPAPGPLQFGAPPPAGASPSPAFSPQASKATAFTPAPEPTGTEVSQVVAPSTVDVEAPSSVEVEAPSRTPRIRPVLTPSTSSASMILSSPTTIWAFLMGFMLFTL